MIEEFYWVMGLGVIALAIGAAVGFVWSLHIERQHQRRLEDEYGSPAFWGEDQPALGDVVSGFTITLDDQGRQVTQVDLDRR